MLRKHANTPNWAELSLPHVHLLLKQAGEYTEWTFTMSALSAAIKIFGSEEEAGEAVNEPGSLPSIDQIEAFQSFARGSD